MFLGPGLSKLECEFQDAINTDPRHHGLLGDELAIGIGEHPSADRRILAFGVFSDYPEIDVARLSVGQRRWHAWHQPYRPEIDVLIELPPELDERSPQRNVTRNFRGPADRAEIDGVVFSDQFFPILRH